MTTINPYDRAVETAKRITTATGIVLLVAFIIACALIVVALIDPQKNIVVVGCSFALGAYIAVRLFDALAQHITITALRRWVNDSYGYKITQTDARKLAAGQVVYLPAQNHAYYLTLDNGERVLAAA